MLANHMRTQIKLCGTPIVTELAGIRFFSSMYSCMSRKICSTSERLVTETAGPTFPTCQVEQEVAYSLFCAIHLSTLLA